MKISVVSPVYNAVNVLDKLVSRIENSISALSNDYEIILVNDASLDDSWHCIEKICARNKKVVGINLGGLGALFMVTRGPLRAPFRGAMASIFQTWRLLGTWEWLMAPC